MTQLSPDELRISQAIRRWAQAFEERHARRPFSFDGIRAKALIKVAEAIEAGRHR